MTKEDDLKALLCELKSNLYQLFSSIKMIDTPLVSHLYLKASCKYALGKVDQSLDIVKVCLEILCEKENNADYEILAEGEK
jgi:hypothetical protein